MVVRLLGSSTSAKPVIDYSEKKCAEGNASVVHIRNLKGDDMFTIYHTFEQYESNLAIAAKTKNIAFHMAVNPGYDDGITEDQCIGFIDEIMNSLGYADQPYVVYRHNDIDREHYHVVSVNVDKNGKKIPADFFAYKIKHLATTLEKKYNFTFGLSGNQAVRDIVPGEVDAKDRNIIGRLAVNFNDILNNYHYASIGEFQACLLSRNIVLKHNPDKDIYMFAVGNEYGVVKSHYYSPRKILGESWRNFEQDIQANAKGNDGVIRLKMENAAMMLQRCVDTFNDTNDIVHVLRSEGYTLMLNYDDQKKLTNAVIVDQHQRCAMDVALLSITLFNQLQEKRYRKRASEAVLQQQEKKINHSFKL